ncbi:unnamed protein product, partial [Porites evermanni]
MSLPENPLKEPSNEDYTATDSSEAESDSLPLLKDIHRDDEDAPDQPAFIAAGDKDLHPWAELAFSVTCSTCQCAVQVLLLVANLVCHGDCKSPLIKELSTSKRQSSDSETSD